MKFKLDTTQKVSTEVDIEFPFYYHVPDEGDRGVNKYWGRITVVDVDDEGGVEYVAHVITYRDNDNEEITYEFSTDENISLDSYSDYFTNPKYVCTERVFMKAFKSGLNDILSWVIPNG